MEIVEQKLGLELLSSSEQTSNSNVKSQMGNVEGGPMPIQKLLKEAGIKINQDMYQTNQTNNSAPENMKNINMYGTASGAKIDIKFPKPYDKGYPEMPKDLPKLL